MVTVLAVMPLALMAEIVGALGAVVKVALPDADDRPAEVAETTSKS